MQKPKKPNTNSKQNRWTRDRVKEDYWQNQIKLWQQSGLSVRAYCQEHGVVESSFYAWRRELIIRARETGDPDATDERVAVKDSRGRLIPMRFRQSDQQKIDSVLSEKSSGNLFVPIEIVESASNDSVVPVQTAPQQSQELEIALPGGAVVRLTDQSNVRLVAELLSALKG